MRREEATAYLESLTDYERVAPDAAARARFTLDPVRDLAARLGNPQDRFPVVHVAGTKGKGSVCAFTAAVLRAAGLRVGLYTSPHLCDFRERLRLDGKMISRERFAAVLSRCRPHLEKSTSRLDASRPPTYFETLTLLALLWFAEEKAEVAVIETGLGGRLDATNIVRPTVCGVTPVSRDHTAYLGESLAEIAREKAGIIKPGVPVVCAPQPPEAEKVLAERAAAVGAPFELLGQKIIFRELFPGADRETSSTGRDEPPRTETVLPDGRRFTAQLGLWGAHQTVNLATAVRLADTVHAALKGAGIPAAAVERGAAEVVWPGRLEEALPAATRNAEVRRSLKDGARLFLDGAHNDASLRAALAALRRRLPHRPPTLLFACAADKNLPAMFDLLATKDAETTAATETFEVAGAVFTKAPHPRALSPEKAAELWRRRTGRAAAAFADCRTALLAALRRAGPQGSVLATGSLYLVGLLKELLAGD